MTNTTKCMLVGFSHKLSKSRDLHLTHSDYKIECVKQYKLLGVNLDTNLKWSFHVDTIHKKLTNKVLNTIQLFTSNSRYELRSEFRCHLAQPKMKSYYSNLTFT